VRRFGFDKVINNEGAMTKKPGYEFLDCGNRRKLERFGEVVTDRPCPQAAWAPGLPEAAWQEAGAVFHRRSGGGSTWEFKVEAPADDWSVAFGDITLGLRPAGNGQVGVFAEQLVNWRWIQDAVANADREISVLNTFAYTGAASLFAAAAGASVCHVDAAKSSVTQTRLNAELSGLADRPLRLIVDDMVTFMEKEVRRGRTYDGIILDPPAFGRSKSGKTWSLIRQLPQLLDLTARLMSRKPLFLLLSCHDPEINRVQLSKMLRGLIPAGNLETGELVLESAHGVSLPAGIYARGLA